MEAKTGDLVTIDEIEGILMPSDQNSIVIKLKNGYNIGFKKEKVKDIKLIKKKQEIKNKESIENKKLKNKQEIKNKESIENKKLKNIIILNTGGTITSKVDYETGGVISQTSSEELIALYPEIRNIANIKTIDVTKIMSEDINFKEYQNISEAIKNNLNCDGIIITHGTDTITYTSAALSFIFENLNIPIILIGSQRSSDRGSADSAMNLICAANFIVKSDFVGIAICMHHTQNDDKCSILSGTKTRKMHTSRRDAFKSINDIPIALIDYETKNIEFLKNYNKKKEQTNLIYKNQFSEEVCFLKIHPNIKTKLIEFCINNYKGIILENTGLGHAPTNTIDNKENYELLNKFIKNKGIIGITSQCLYGRVHPNVYTNLRRLSNIGCIFCEDMLPETAYIKLSWLLANYPDKVDGLLNKNLRDEILERSTSENYIE